MLFTSSSRSQCPQIASCVQPTIQNTKKWPIYRKMQNGTVYWVKLGNVWHFCLKKTRRGEQQGVCSGPSDETRGCSEQRDAARENTGLFNNVWTLSLSAVCHTAMLKTHRGTFPLCYCVCLSLSPALCSPSSPASIYLSSIACPCSVTMLYLSSFSLFPPLQILGTHQRRRR